MQCCNVGPSGRGPLAPAHARPPRSLFNIRPCYSCISPHLTSASPHTPTQLHEASRHVRCSLSAPRSPTIAAFFTFVCNCFAARRHGQTPPPSWAAKRRRSGQVSRRRRRRRRQPSSNGFSTRARSGPKPSRQRTSPPRCVFPPPSLILFHALLWFSPHSPVSHCCSLSSVCLPVD